jgi:hypothetical protein
VLDVKSGSGAFMPTHEQSEALAESLVAVANGAGTKTSALLTDMNEVLGHAAGNAVEVATAVEFLTGAAQDPRVREITLALCAEMLVLGGLASEAESLAKVADALDSGKAAEKFSEMVTLLGGPSDFVERYQDLSAAPPRRDRCPGPGRMASSAPWTPVRSVWPLWRSAVGAPIPPTPSTMPSASPTSPMSAQSFQGRSFGACACPDEATAQEAARRVTAPSRWVTHRLRAPTSIGASPQREVSDAPRVSGRP